MKTLGRNQPHEKRKRGLRVAVLAIVLGLTACSRKEDASVSSQGASTASHLAQASPSSRPEMPEAPAAPPRIPQASVLPQTSLPRQISPPFAEVRKSSRAPAAEERSSTPLLVPESVPPVLTLSTPRASIIREFWMWFGLGVNFTSYSQSVPGLSDVNFGRIKSPSQSLRTGFFFDDHFGLDLGYQDTPGEASSSPTLTVQNGAYHWKTMSAEALYRPALASEGRNSEWLWRLGIQQHQMPFLTPVNANQIAMTENSLTTASLGVEYRKFTRRHLRLETNFRAQLPLSSSGGTGSSVDLNPKLSFDGSVGAAYEIKPNLFLGTYWHGQYHRSSFELREASGSAFQGKQEMIYTNFDVRIGFEF